MLKEAAQQAQAQERGAEAVLEAAQVGAVTSRNGVWTASEVATHTAQG